MLCTAALAPSPSQALRSSLGQAASAHAAAAHNRSASLNSHSLDGHSPDSHSLDSDSSPHSHGLDGHGLALLLHGLAALDYLPSERWLNGYLAVSGVGLTCITEHRFVGDI